MANDLAIWTKKTGENWQSSDNSMQLFEGANRAFNFFFLKKNLFWEQSDTSCEATTFVLYTVQCEARSDWMY